MRITTMATVFSVLMLFYGYLSAQDGGIDIIFLIDDSRSMVVNDPTEMRKVALKAFLDLTQERGGDRIGVLRFCGWESGGRPFLVFPLTEIPRRSDKRVAVLSAIKKAIDEKVTASGMATDFNYAFKVALEHIVKDLKKTDRPLWIILFTDGEMTPNLIGLKQRSGGKLPSFYASVSDAVKALEEVCRKARMGEGPFGNIDYARAQLKQKRLALRRKVEQLFEKTVIDQAKTLFAGKKVVVSMVYLRSATDPTKVKTPEELKRKNAVAAHLAKHLNAKLHLVGQRGLKSVFFDILKDVSRFWEPGLLRCYHDASLAVPAGKTVRQSIHIFQGAEVTKIVLFARNPEFEVRLLKDRTPVKGVQVAGEGERYRILTVRDVPFGDYTIEVSNRGKEHLVLDVVAYAQVELKWSLLDKHTGGGPLSAGGELAFAVAPAHPHPKADVWFALVATDKTGRTLSDPKIMDSFLIRLTIPAPKRQPAPFSYASLNGKWQIHRGVGFLSQPGVSEVVVEGEVVVRSGDKRITICRLPSIKSSVKILAPVMELTTKPSSEEKILEFQRLNITGRIIAGKPSTKQADALKIVFVSDKKERVETTLRFEAGLFLGEVRLPAGKWGLAGNLFADAKISNAKDLSLTIRSRRVELNPQRLTFRGFTEKKLSGVLKVTYDTAPDEQAEIEISQIKTSMDAVAAVKTDKKVFELSKEGCEIPFEFEARTERAAGEAGTITLKVWVKGVPQTEKRLKVGLFYEYVPRPFPWWIVGVAAAALISLIILIWALTRPVFTEQQFWLRTEKQYMLRDLGKRKAPATEQAPNSLLFILKGSKKEPVCHLKPVSEEWTVIVDNEKVERLTPLRHGSWITLRRNGEKLEYRYFDRQPTEWELLGVPYEPDAEYFLIIEEEPET